MSYIEERDRMAEQTSRDIRLTLSEADARVRHFKLGYDAALRSSVVRGLVDALIAVGNRKVSKQQFHDALFAYGKALEESK